MATDKQIAVSRDRAQGFFKWLGHNRYLAAGIVLSVFVAVLFAACVPKTASLILPPPAQVNSAQLQAELITIQGNYDTIIKKAEIAQADLEAQYAQRAQIVGIVGGVVNLAAGGGLNPINGAAAGLQLLTLLGGAGLLLDNRRKDGVIKAQKTTANSTAKI